MDPGSFHMTDGQHRVTLESEIFLDAFNLASGILDLNVRHAITTLVPDPLRSTRHAALTSEVDYAGISRTVTLLPPREGASRFVSTLAGGVAGGTPDQDVEVALATLTALGLETP